VDVHRHLRSHDRRHRLPRRDRLDVRSKLLFRTFKANETGKRSPAGGGVYHWTGALAPLPLRGLLSYLVGWSGALAWAAAAAVLNLVAATAIQALAALRHPGYDPQRWHGALLAIGLGTLAAACNAYGVRRLLPALELVMLALHFFGVLVVLVPLWALAPKASASDVFTRFEDGGGWGNVGLACLVGQIGPVFALSRADGAIHIGRFWPKPPFPAR
jgi:choline transport protein